MPQEDPMRRLTLSTLALILAPAIANAECTQPTGAELVNKPSALLSFTICLHNQQAEALRSQSEQMISMSELANQHSAAFVAIQEQNAALRSALIKATSFLNDAVLENQSLRRRVELLETKVDRLNQR
jgi:uncharacterized protein YbjT (DUF2867 family)